MKKRNHIIFLFSLLGLIFTSCGFSNFLKDSEAFKSTETFLKDNSTIKNYIGDIQSFDKVTGSINIKNSTGNAEFSFQIIGSKQNGQAQVSLQKTGTQWDVASAYLQTADGQNYNLKSAHTKLEIVNSFVSKTKYGTIHKPAIFKVGEKAFFNLYTRGFKQNEKNEAFVQIDVEVTTHTGEVIEQKNVIVQTFTVKREITDLYVSIPMRENYVNLEKWNRLKIIVHDRFAGKSVDVSHNFQVHP